MTCREFRRRHDAYLDDTLSGVEMEAMDVHRRVCEVCSQHDTRVRRAIFMARNLPTIEPSQDFSRKLQERLAQERAARELLKSAAAPRVQSGLTMGTYGIVAAGLIIAAGMAAIESRASTEVAVAQPIAQVQAQPVAVPNALTAPTMVAAMPAGMPLWPAVFVAQEAPWHLASDEATR